MRTGKWGFWALFFKCLHARCDFLHCTFEGIIYSVCLIVGIGHYRSSTRSRRPLCCFDPDFLYDKVINHEVFIYVFCFTRLVRKNVPLSFELPFAKGLTWPLACIIPVNLSLMLIFCGFRITILNCWVDGFGWTRGPGPVILKTWTWIIFRHVKFLRKASLLWRIMFVSCELAMYTNRNWN